MRRVTSLYLIAIWTAARRVMLLLVISLLWFGCSEEGHHNPLIVSSFQFCILSPQHPPSLLPISPAWWDNVMDQILEATEDESEGGSDSGSSSSEIRGFGMTDLASTYLRCILAKSRCPISGGRGQRTKLSLMTDDRRCQRLQKWRKQDWRS